MPPFLGERRLSGCRWRRRRWRPRRRRSASTRGRRGADTAMASVDMIDDPEAGGIDADGLAGDGLPRRCLASWISRRVWRLGGDVRSAALVISMRQPLCGQNQAGFSADGVPGSVGRVDAAACCHSCRSSGWVSRRSEGRPSADAAELLQRGRTHDAGGPAGGLSRQRGRVRQAEDRGSRPKVNSRQASIWVKSLSRMAGSCIRDRRRCGGTCLLIMLDWAATMVHRHAVGKRLYSWVLSDGRVPMAARRVSWSVMRRSMQSMTVVAHDAVGLHVPRGSRRGRADGLEEPVVRTQMYRTGGRPTRQVVV